MGWIQLNPWPVLGQQVKERSLKENRKIFLMMCKLDDAYWVHGNLLVVLIICSEDDLNALASEMGISSPTPTDETIPQAEVTSGSDQTGSGQSKSGKKKKGRHEVYVSRVFSNSWQ